MNLASHFRAKRLAVTREGADMALGRYIDATAEGRTDAAAIALQQYANWSSRAIIIASGGEPGPILNAGDREAGERV